MARWWAICITVVVVGLQPCCRSTTSSARDPRVAFTVVNGDRSLELTDDDLAKLPRVTLHVEERGQEEAVDGVPLSELLRLAGAPLGDALRGGNLALYVVVEAADDYKAVFALAELDPGMSDRPVLLISSKDGHPLANGEGPLRVVAPADKRHARWVRQAIGIRVARAGS